MNKRRKDGSFEIKKDVSRLFRRKGEEKGYKLLYCDNKISGITLVALVVTIIVLLILARC